LLAELSVIESKAAAAPWATGANVTATEQLAPTLTPAWQVFAEENSLAFAPPIEKTGAGKSAVPVLVIVIACTALDAGND